MTPPPAETGPAPSDTRSPWKVAVRSWIASGVTVLIFSYFGGSALISAITLSTSELLQNVQIENITAEQRNMLRPAMIVLSSLVLLFMVVPALINLGLGFWVRRGSRRAAVAAMGLTLVPAVLASGFGIIILANAVFTGNLIAGILVLIVVGGYVAMMLWSARALWLMQPANQPQTASRVAPRPGVDDSDNDEPWNAHLR